MDGNNYYFKNDGTAITKNTTINGVRYKFTADGVCTGKFTGISTRNGSKYYYKNGIMQTGWVTRNDKTYYFGSDGKMRTGIYQTDNVEYDLGYDGEWDGVKGKITVQPNTVGEYLTLTDFASAASVEVRVGLKKFKTLENTDKLFEMLSESSDRSFEYGSSPSYDEVESPQNIYSNSTTDIMVRFKDENGVVIGGWYFSKDKKGNGYFFNYFRNFGAVLKSSDIYDMLKDAYNQ
ncbi:MAG: hypothetical protein J1E40_07255 [Oscillospiraceae bacterium]|nr:hypothetical protein [Oscillospiraceae bacterium]